MFIKIKVSDKSAIFLNTDFFRVCRVEVVDGYAHLMILNILEILKITWRVYSAFTY